MIQQVEELRFELKADSFCKRCFFAHRKVEGEQARPYRGIPADIPVKARLLQLKGAGIKPPARILELLASLDSRAARRNPASWVVTKSRS